MEQQKTKKRDNEGLILAVLCVIFGGTLLACDLLYKNIDSIFKTAYVIPWLAAHLMAIIFCLIVAFKSDENKYRYWAIAFLFISIILTMAHRSSYNDNKMMQEDIENNKKLE